LTNPLSPVSVANLDKGEAAVTELALEKNIPLVSIDNPMVHIIHLQTITFLNCNG
jgi:hypothetical protein